MNRVTFFKLVQDRPTGELSKLQQAYYLFKAGHHHTPPRSTGERYYTHPRAVTLILMEFGYQGTKQIILGLFHDTPEDCFIPSEIIVDLFGTELWDWIKRISKKLPLFDPVNGVLLGRIHKTLEEYFDGIRNGPREVKLCKVADRIHNLRTCGHWDAAHIRRYIRETEQYILPIAHEVDERMAQALIVETKNLRMHMRTRNKTHKKK